MPSFDPLPNCDSDAPPLMLTDLLWSLGVALSLSALVLMAGTQWLGVAL